MKPNINPTLLTLPEETLIEFENQRIDVTKVEETSSSTHSTALYQDANGNLYVILIEYRSLEESLGRLKRKSITLPDDRELLRAAEETRISVREVTQIEALEWYVDEFMNDGFLKDKIAEAIRLFANPASRPVWPCREEIDGVVYDSDKAQHVASAADTTLYRTHQDSNRPGRYFFASRGECIRPCSPAAAVEAILGYYLAPICLLDFAKFMPSLNVRHPLTESSAPIMES
jgi:hypothetical protein